MGLLDGLFTVAVDVVRVPFAVAHDVVNMGDDIITPRAIEKTVEDVGKVILDPLD